MGKADFHQIVFMDSNQTAKEVLGRMDKVALDLMTTEVLDRLDRVALHLMVKKVLDLIAKVVLDRMDKIVLELVVEITSPVLTLGKKNKETQHRPGEDMVIFLTPEVNVPVVVTVVLTSQGLQVFMTVAFPIVTALLAVPGLLVAVREASDWV